MHDDNKPAECCNGCQSLMWWATLVVAVLAVPSFGIVVAYVIPVKGLWQIGVFILACWFCTWLGMKLMEQPGMNERIGRGPKKPD